MSPHPYLTVALLAALAVPATLATPLDVVPTGAAAPEIQATALPVLGSVAVTGASETQATVSAVVITNLVATTVRVEYGPTPAYGAQTAAQTIPGSLLPRTRVLTLDGLAPGTVHHFRVVASNAFATVAGPDATVTTLASGVADGTAVPSLPALPGLPGATSPLGGGGGGGGRPTPPDDQPDADPLAPVLAASPVIGERMAVAPAAGTVLVRLPGSERFAPLSSGAAIPIGSVIDTRRGRITMTTALPDGAVQTASFWGGTFTVRQARTGSGIVRLRLQAATGCSRPAGAARGHSEDARRNGRAASRRPALWGKDRNGRYRTEGANSVATVRGTEWLTVNRCDGTLTRVREGAVLVRDLRTGRGVLVTAGRSYLARAKAAVGSGRARADRTPPARKGSPG